MSCGVNLAAFLASPSVKLLYFMSCLFSLLVASFSLGCSQNHSTCTSFYCMVANGTLRSLSGSSHVGSRAATLVTA